MTDKKTLGRFGEDRAARYLFFHGYRIVKRNWACRLGEIDVIARKGKYIAFVEVKLRHSADYGEAREFVTAQKQRRVIAAAELYLAKNPTDLQPRFDVIEIYAPYGTRGRTKINHIENAFM